MSAREPEGPRGAPRAGAARDARRGRADDGPVFYVSGFWRRAAAAAIDLAYLIPIGLAAAWLAGALSGLHLPASTHRSLDFWLDLLLALDPALLGGLGLVAGIGVLYALLFQGAAAQTPGMRVMGVKIIDVYGEPPSVLRAAARTAGYLAGIATLGLGFFWIAFDREKRGLLDWIAGTYVVKV